MRGKKEPLLRSEFDKHTIRIELSGFSMSESDESMFQNHYQMMNLTQLTTAIDSLDSMIVKRLDDFATSVNTRLIFMNDTTYNPDTVQFDTAGFTVMGDLNQREQLQIYSTALNLARANKTYANSMGQEIENRQKTLNRHIIEWHRKFTLSIACLVLFFVGAPLGAIIRKGGLGMPVVISVIFFLIWHITSMTGEKLVKQGEIPAIQGMWYATYLLTPIGIFLTYKATTDSVLLDATFYAKLIAPFKPLITPIVKLFKKAKKKKKANS